MPCPLSLFLAWPPPLLPNHSSSTLLLGFYPPCPAPSPGGLTHPLHPSTHRAAEPEGPLPSQSPLSLDLDTLDSQMPQSKADCLQCAVQPLLLNMDGHDVVNSGGGGQIYY